MNRMFHVAFLDKLAYNGTAVASPTADWEFDAMASENRLEGKDSGAPAKSRARIMPPELAEQVKILADQPSEGVLWSDVFDGLRDGFINVRRLISARHAQAAR